MGARMGGTVAHVQKQMLLIKMNIQWNNNYSFRFNRDGMKN